MVTLPFWHKKQGEAEKHVLMLFLGGEKAYGFAFEEKKPNNHSTLYQEHIDPFLKDAAKKIETIILNCERDLNDNVYLKKTVLFLNSLYTTETGAIREDFYKEIKKLLKGLDLENLGYVTFNEVIIHNFGHQDKEFYLIEENLYDYSISYIKEEAVMRTHKVAKTQHHKEVFKAINKHLDQGIKTLGFFHKKPMASELKVDQIIEIEQLPELLTKVYFKEKKGESKIESGTKAATYTEVDIAHIDKQYSSAAEAFSMAPGFKEVQESLPEEVPKSQTKNEHWSLPTIKVPHWSFASPKKRRILLVLIPILIVLLIPFYLAVFHRAEIFLTTKKENFSTKTSFEITEQDGSAKSYNQPVDIKTSQQTTGEKVSGEKASGEITIYNGSFSETNLPSGTQVQKPNGAIFVLQEDTAVPAATISANLNEGVATTAFGKRTVNVQAAEIGAEGNIDSGTKLIFSDYTDDELYALAVDNFSGGVKKTVQIYSSKDKGNLSAKAQTLAKKELINKFTGEENKDNYVFPETFKMQKAQEKFSADIGDEVDQVDEQLTGTGTILFTPYSQLIKQVQEEELKDKEFVEGTFQLAQVELEKKQNNTYIYSALVKGQVQNLVDKEGILQNITGRTKWTANQVLENQNNIIDHRIKIRPIPIPIIPFKEKAIIFKYKE